VNAKYVVMGIPGAGKRNFTASLSVQLEIEGWSHADIQTLQAQKYYQYKLREFQRVIPKKHICQRLALRNRRGETVSIACLSRHYDRTQLSRLTDALTNINGMLFLIDPRPYLLSHTTLAGRSSQDGNTDREDGKLLQCVIESLKSVEGSSISSTVKMPVAFVFTKRDAYCDISDPLDWVRSSKELSQILELRQLEFETSDIFWVSAFGTSPKGGRFSRYTPTDVIEPFRWLLTQRSQR
jgi:hypothetical protein